MAKIKTLTQVIDDNTEIDILPRTKVKAISDDSGKGLDALLNEKQGTLDIQTAYAAKGSATKVPQITTNNLGQVIKIEEIDISHEAVPDPTASGSATAFIDSISQNASGVISVTKKNLDTSGTWSGKATTAGTADQVKSSLSIGGKSYDGSTKISITLGDLGAQAAGNYKTTQDVVDDPTASGDSLTFIDTISQNANGKISVTKKNVNTANILLGNAATATALTSNAGSTSQPIYFNEGKPVAITGAIGNDTTGNAATATALTSNAGSAAQPIYFNEGKPVAITGSISNDITGNAATATALTTSAGSTTQPIYFSSGVPVAITGTIENSTAGNAATASKVNNALSIGGKSFDGSAGVSISLADLGAQAAGSYKTIQAAVSDPIVTEEYIEQNITAFKSGQTYYYKVDGKYVQVASGEAFDESKKPYYILTPYSDSLISSTLQDTNGVVTLAKKYAKLHNALTFGNKEYDGSQSMELTAADLNIIQALTFIGKTDYDLDTTYKTTQTIHIPAKESSTKYVGGMVTADPGSLVIWEYTDSSSKFHSKQYYWDDDIKEWVCLTTEEEETSILYKYLQKAVTDSEATSGAANIKFVSSVTQDEQGLISVVKSDVRDASTTQSGVVSTGDQAFAGLKTFNSGVKLGSNLSFSSAYTIDWDSDTYRQRIAATDDATADTAVFSFQQSADGGTSYSDLMTIRDNGKVIATTFVGALSGNASTATTLATARSINGTSFNGSADITTAKWGTSRTISINSTAGTTGTTVDGSNNATLVIPSTMTGFTSITSTGFTGALTGNASTASALATARTLTVGSTGKAFDGSGNISWTHAEIGATVSNTWTAGTTAGPTLSTTVNGVTGTAVAIPTATASASGIVTNAAQTFGGTKTFNDTTDSSNSTATASVTVKGGVSVAKQMSAKTVRIDNGSTSSGCTLQFDTTNNCLNFVFA